LSKETKAKKERHSSNLEDWKDDFLSGFLNAANEAMLLVGLDGTIVGANPSAYALFGYAESELIGKSLLLLIPERFRAPHQHHESNFFR